MPDSPEQVLLPTGLCPPPTDQTWGKLSRSVALALTQGLAFACGYLPVPRWERMPSTGPALAIPTCRVMGTIT